jgi:hypothetical protein
MSILSLFGNNSSRSRFADFQPIDVSAALTPPPPPTDVSETSWSSMRSPLQRTPGSSATWPVEYQRAMRRNVVDTAAPADAGRISQDNGRLAIFGKLQGGDAADSYKFTIGSTGKVQLFAPNPAYKAGDADSKSVLGDVRMQVIDKSGKVIADSEPTTGLLFSAYVNLSTEGLKGLEMQAGQYTVKLTRNNGVDAKKALDYTLFLVQGDPGRTTFYTVERQPAKQGARQVQAQPNPIVNLFS